jgi:hypothetical protein
MAHVERGFIKALDVVAKGQHPHALAAWLIEKISARLPNRKTIRRHDAGTTPTSTAAIQPAGQGNWVCA